MTDTSNSTTPTGHRSRRSGLAILALFAAVALSVPVGLFTRAAVGEPYPWLFQPSFGYVINKDGVIDSENPVVTAITTDGRKLSIDPERLMPDSRLSGVLMFLNNFRRESVAMAPATEGWLTERLAELYPDQHFAKLTITWANERITLATGARHPESNPRVDTIELIDEGSN